LTKASFFRINDFCGFEKCFYSNSNLHNKLTMNTSLKKLSFAAVFVATFASAQAASSLLTFNFQSTNGAAHGGSGPIPAVGVTGATASDVTGTNITYTPNTSSATVTAPVVVSLNPSLGLGSTLNITFSNTGGGTDPIGIGYDNDADATNFNYGPGVGTGQNSGNEIDGPNNVTITFDKPVVLTQVQAAWWDANNTENTPDSYRLTIDGTGRNAVPATEGGLHTLTDGAPWVGGSGFTSSTVDGVTGVYLPAGQAFVVSGVDTNANGTIGDNGLLQRFSFHVVNPIPEPTSLTLGALGLLGLLRRRRA
jgi:hypothetical protein